MYSEKFQKSLVKFVLDNIGEEDVQDVILDMFRDNQLVLVSVDKERMISFFAALVSFGKYQLIYNAVPKLFTNWDDATEENFSKAFQMDKEGAYPLDRAYMLEDGEEKEKIISKLIEIGYGYVGFGAINFFLKGDVKTVLERIYKENEKYNLHHRRQIHIPWNSFFKQKTFLMNAVEFVAFDCIKFLVEEIGVKVDLKNEEGDTALDIAKLMGNEEIAQYLEKKLKK